MLGTILVIGFSIGISTIIGISEYVDEQKENAERNKLYGIIVKQSGQIDDLIHENRQLKLEKVDEETK